MLTRSVLACGCGPRAASAFSLDASFSSAGFHDGTGQATQDGSTTTTKGKVMKTTNTAQNNIKSTRGRDLGQITAKASFYPGNTEIKTLPSWFASIRNKSGFELVIPDGDEPKKNRCIDYGFNFEEGFKNIPTNTYRLALALAELTSKSKLDRDYAKAKVKTWADNGLALMQAAQAAIDEAKATEAGK